MSPYSKAVTARYHSDFKAVIGRYRGMPVEFNRMLASPATVAISRRLLVATVAILCENVVKSIHFWLIFQDFR